MDTNILAGMNMKKFNWNKFWKREILAPECDELCRFRHCLVPGEDKGSYTPGKGYTEYKCLPEPVCLTRLLHGCPGKGKRPEPDWDEMKKWTYQQGRKLQELRHIIEQIVKWCKKS